MDMTFKLQVFEGPLDLLLHLLEKNKVNIYDIPIVEITNQYMEYIAEMRRQDLNVMSEFLVMAATLLDIKSKMLLPAKESEDEEEEDPRADDMYLFIQGSKRVTLDENGVLHAAYKNNALYMEDDEGISDIPMILTESDISDVENRYLSFVVLMNFDNWESQAVQLQIAVNEDYPDGIIRNAIPLSDDDDDVQSASKQLIHLDDYANMSVAARCSYVTRDENGELLDFFDWEKSKWMMGFEVDLTSDYRTVVQPLDHPENYVCIFFMKDSQGNVSYSDMIPLK